MDLMTFYAAQGDLAAVRAGNEAVIIDAHMPDCDDVTSVDIAASLSRYLAGKVVRGLILTGLDRDHACPAGVKEILERYEPDWVMYPSYFKDSDTADEVFAIIDKERNRRSTSRRPLDRLSVCLSRLDTRFFHTLASNLAFEMFSPYVKVDDSSNNNGIVVKITGLDATGFTYLATGDTEADRWEAIDRKFGNALKCDVLSAAHHGSRNGVHPGALIHMRPDTVLISAGVDNAFGHPDAAAVKAYARVAKHVDATNSDGGVCLFTRRVGSGFETIRVRHGNARRAIA
jgi:beta-lactamase superfamily II metal-dependent hydrolase